MERLFEMPLQINQIIPKEQPKEKDPSTFLTEPIEQESLQQTLDKFPSEHEFDEPQVDKEKDEQKLADEALEKIEQKIHSSLIGKCIDLRG